MCSMGSNLIRGFSETGGVVLDTGWEAGWDRGVGEGGEGELVPRITLTTVALRGGEPDGWESEILRGELTSWDWAGDCSESVSSLAGSCN